MEPISRSRVPIRSTSMRPRSRPEGPATFSEQLARECRDRSGSQASSTGAALSALTALQTAVTNLGLIQGSRRRRKQAELCDESGAVADHQLFGGGIRHQGRGCGGGSGKSDKSPGSAAGFARGTGSGEFGSAGCTFTAEGVIPKAFHAGSVNVGPGLVRRQKLCLRRQHHRVHWRLLSRRRPLPGSASLRRVCSRF